ncbi:NADH:ubiquinone oxidoreductase subunit 6 (chain J) (NuoJ) (PDB:4HE8) [Commensalibacter communis]|uniref:NADH-quinone oxidoreductase subunit J n=1 Tax=Commensalibacter communis TaxID=2972786 RepID=UPI0022FF74BE|nr:NADH-quinone oxidoreductase subunit J [Commensalibacter communis]CAI3941863.1 NADH:ubiquinone oxidoreductase subunit 6 (chain J) (NuoJ) (PDB:4HE8) [Commensalibacter communis]
MMPIILFYIFAVILLLSAVMVVISRNSVHAALFLVLAFCNASGLFLIAGAEFLAILLIAIYAGAVMILFLFIVMTMQTNLVQLKEGMQHYLPVGFCIAIVLVVELIIVAINWHIDPNVAEAARQPLLQNMSNTKALGSLIYTNYIFLFQMAGLVLLVAMIGAIVLTLRKRPTNRRQVVARQHMREPKQTLEMRSVELNKGVDDLGGYLRPKETYYGIAQEDSFGPKPGDKMDITEKRQEREQSK